MNKQIQVNIGIPASGKSTRSKQQVADGSGSVVRINKDELRAMINYGKYSKQRERGIERARDALLIQYLSNDDIKLVIIDDTNISERHHRHLEQIATENNATVVYEWFDDSFNADLCHKRNAARNPAVPYTVIESMHKQFLRLDSKLRGAVAFPLVQDQSLPKAVVFDIDGTLADHNGIRSPFAWEEVGKDAPKVEIINLSRMYANLGYVVICLSGRDGACEMQTRDWLIRNGVPFDSLFMRPEGSQEKDYVVKERLFMENLYNKYNVEVLFDDRMQVVRLWRAMGLNCCQVDDGYF
jgi:predicted kinase